MDREPPATPEAQTPVRPRASAYVVSALATAALAAWPFLAVTIPPITDLPQQTAQMRLLGEALEGDEAYRIQWLQPNKLGYLPVGLAWLVTTPLAAGRWGMIAIGLLWATAIHALAGLRGRPPATAVLASLFFFNHITYWGFLGFLVGLPAFVGWWAAVERATSGGGTRALWTRWGPALVALAAVVTWAHVLWLGAALAWLIVTFARHRVPRRRAIPILVWLAPLVAAVGVWSFRLTASGLDPRTFWGRLPWGRLHPEWLISSALGGLHGTAEPALLAAVAAWVALGLWRGRRSDRALLLTGALFAAAALCLPAVTQHTIFFASRWLPMAAVFAVLGCRSPRLGAWGTALALALLAALSSATAARWSDFEEQELAGLRTALDALPAGRDHRLLGLDLARTSPRIRGFPFYHLYAYGQVVRGSRLARSFAEEPSSLVVYRRLPHRPLWTPNLDWRPQRLRRSDLSHFDHVLVHGEPAAHGLVAADERLVPRTAPARWRLYEVQRRRPRP